MRTQFKTFAATFFALTSLAAFAVPEVTECTMTQGPGSRLVTIQYKLSETPAVVTLDIETNVVGTADWVSIGGEHIWNAEGAVWRKVTSADVSDGKCVITWHPEQSWKDPEGNGFKVDGTTHKIRAKVTAWALDNTPDYMVVDITATAGAGKERYYPRVDFLPGSELGQIGAVTNNTAYRDTCLLMRKIMAKNVTWTMGELTMKGWSAAHQVTLTNNYYIGVFEVTQNQWAYIQTNRTAASYFTAAEVAAMRPVDKVSYNEIRLAKGTGTSTTGPSATADVIAQYSWPNDPHPDSFLGILRNRTGIDFDLPSEAEWEFAARSGHGEKLWGDGSVWSGSTVCNNLKRLGRYRFSGSIPSGWIDPAGGPPASSSVTNGTSVCGSYLPSDWGLYDMAGNVNEWCLDFSEKDITGYNGGVNIDATSPTNTLSGTIGGNRVVRGGSWWQTTDSTSSAAGSKSCRPGYRVYSYAATTRGVGWTVGQFGLRVVCRAGLN